MFSRIVTSIHTFIHSYASKPKDIKQGRPGNKPRFDVHGFSPEVLKVGKGMCVKSISCAYVVALLASKGMGSVYTS